MSILSHIVVIPISIVDLHPYTHIHSICLWWCCWLFPWGSSLPCYWGDVET
jgi:hypothetical protein